MHSWYSKIEPFFKKMAKIKTNRKLLKILDLFSSVPCKKFLLNYISSILIIVFLDFLESKT
ncbi:hypothetical protein BpHYR1_002688 [Brachionus plicatilis]|uniref:Uncharacterized protein n=1 Tax=Brachionus plicatilis TaxID=10195 RepID=A0A3M7PU67_BRAPC|nr:hypothetical protein BpHYR1_002688 [Brachionus plicatilis]